MYTIKANSVSEALAGALALLRDESIEEQTRNGPVLSMPAPVAVQYNHPRNHILLSPIRDANPFFHFYEAMWMLAGKNDVTSVAYFNKRMAEYSDDGIHFWGAYGYRWRTFFGDDQLVDIIQELQDNPQTRRCVLGMWSPGEDLAKARQGGKDVPCNTQAYFRIVDGRLDMTVTNRSNDVLWGAFGANAVHFGFLHEYVSNCVGVPQGRYYQISNNLHLYTNILPRENIDALIEDLFDSDPYYADVDTTNTFYITPERGLKRDDWDHAIGAIIEDDFRVETWERMSHQFFRFTAYNVFDAWDRWKQHGVHAALESAIKIQDPIWKKACTEWLQRRAKKLEERRTQ